MLKLDPKNTELLSQKQKVLNENIQTTEEKLKQLKEIKAKADEAMANGTEINEQNYRNLQREIIATQTKLSDLKNEASNWTKAGDKLIQWGENLDKISQKIDSLGSKLTTRITLPITAAATAGLTYDAQIEKYETAFKTFLGSAEKAGEAIKNIKDDAKRTPFDTTSLVKANQMLISTGVDAKDAREDILALGEAIVATGGGNDELVRMASNLQQIKNAGKATAMDIRQFAYAGIDVYGILADYTGKSTKDVKKMDISYKDLTKALKKASSNGGKYFGAMANSSETLTGQVSALKSEVQDMTGELVKSLMPTAKKVVARARELIKTFDGLSDSEKENIVKIGLLVAAAGPALKMASSAIGIIGSVSKGIGTFSKAVALAHNGIGTAEGSAAKLAKVLQGLTSPAGLAAIGITTAVGIIIAQMKKANEESKKAFENMGTSASDYLKGIDSAKSHLSEFNRTLFVSSEEQKKLEEEMEEVQKGITQICQTASKERRDYTQKEIKQLDEYFKKLRELNQRELEIEQSIATAISQQAKTTAESFEGSLEEYKTQSQEWIKTAEEQKTKEIELINTQTTEEIALLNQRFGSKATLENEAYKSEYEKIISNKEEKIKQANDEVAEISSIYTKGYAERASQDGDFYEHIQHYNWEQEQEEKRHNSAIESIQNNKLLTTDNKNAAIESENKRHSKEQEKIWKDMYKNMSDSESKQLGSWLGMLSQTELYGGQIDDETKKLVDKILDSYKDMPKGTREAMKNAMTPMLEEMEKKEPSLFSKATSIANGILSRLRKAFDEHSPSKETRKIFKYLMQGAELGLDDERKNLNAEAEKIAKEALNSLNMSNLGINSGLKNGIIDSTKTIFTTPQIIFNVQELDEAKLQQCFNYVNRKFGSAY